MSELSAIHAALSDLQRSTGRIEGTVTAMNERMKSREEEHDRLEARVSKVENRQAYSAGKATMYGAAAGGVLGYLSKLFFPGGGA